jgi:hypothetical protein
MRFHKAAKANAKLQEAIEVAVDLGNTYIIKIIKAVQDEIYVENERSSQKDVFLSSAPSPTKSRTHSLSNKHTEEKQELELILKEVNASEIEVVLRAPQLGGGEFRCSSRFDGIKKLLPQGKRLETLPDAHYWRMLLNTAFNPHGHKLERIGTTLLNDLLPVRSEGRRVFGQLYSRSLDRPTLHCTIQGDALECLPWGILHDRSTQTYLATQACFAYNSPPEKPLLLQGSSLAVFPSSTDRMSDSTVYQIQSLYEGSKSTDRWFSYSDLLSKTGPLKSVVSSAESLLEQVKMLHIVGDLSQFDEVEGVFLNMGNPDPSRVIEHLTPDHLARRLRQLNIRNCLIVLEPLSTNSDTEDVRVLMLRNSYATALAQLGPWTVLALGPRHCPTTTMLIEQLHDQDILTVDQLEKDLLEARRRAAELATEDFKFLLEGQFELFYPSIA